VRRVAFVVDDAGPLRQSSENGRKNAQKYRNEVDTGVGESAALGPDQQGGEPKAEDAKQDVPAYAESTRPKAHCESNGKKEYNQDAKEEEDKKRGNLPQTFDLRVPVTLDVPVNPQDSAIRRDIGPS
jgi:hypothetical protein